MIKKWIRFETVEEDRDGYFVSYSPVFSGEPLATLTVTFYKDIETKRAISILEKEFESWISRYPTPLMGFIRNETDKKIDHITLTGNNYLIGYPAKDGTITKAWDEMGESEYNDFDLSDEKLKSIYSDLSIRTNKDAELERQKSINTAKIIRYSTILWYCIIPALIAWLGWSNPLVSLIALIYSLYMAFKEYLRLTGQLKKTQRQEEKDEDKRLKEHHHYHCKINPSGFERLKVENFEMLHKQRLTEKIEKLQN